MVSDLSFLSTNQEFLCSTRRSTSPCTCAVGQNKRAHFSVAARVVDKTQGYILGQRNKVPGAKKHGYLFVTHKSGTSQGRPLSNAAFGKFMGELRLVVEGCNGIHAHSLRHHWNYSFSAICEGINMSPEREEKIRSYLMGLSETSGTAATCNLRYIKEQVDPAVNLSAISDTHYLRY